MNRTFSVFALGGLSLLPWMVPACSGDPVSCEEARTCGDAADGGRDVTTTDGPSETDAPSTTDGDTEAAPDAGPDTAPPGCDASKDPKDSLACVANTYGLFVDASKPAGGTGTKANPFSTLGAALTAAASATQKRIYVCAGTYAEAVTVTSAISLYGGWACADWSYAGTKAKVAPSAVGIALKVDGVASALTVEDLEFDAQPGTIAAPSSIAALVNASPSLTLSRVALVAGGGGPATDGTAGVTGTPTPADLSGITGGAAGSNADKTCTCSSGGSSTGGKGGVGGAAGAGDGNDGKVAQAVVTPEIGRAHV